MLLAFLVIYPFAVMTVDLPRYTYDPLIGECSTSNIPLTKLARLEAWGIRRGTRMPVLLRSKPEIGREGQRDTLHLPIYEDSGVWTVWAVCVGLMGGRSCPSNESGVNLTVSAPNIEPLAIPRVEWFDLNGRRIAKPMMPGVYFTRWDQGKQRVVILK